MHYTIFHETKYRYPVPVHESYTVVHLKPRSDTGQFCTRYELIVEPSAKAFTYVDRYGNDVQHFSILPEHQLLSVVARSAVATARGELTAIEPVALEDVRRHPGTPWYYDFLQESTYIKFGGALEALAVEIGEPAPTDDAVAWLQAASRAIKAGFVYDKHATSVRTTVDESIRVRGGVCQDFAHVLTALARRAGIPARYVSGYVRTGSAVLGAEASHAWCEAYFGALGWIGIDPTNDIWVGDDFVKIAVGRDYRDVSPVRGIYKGGRESELEVTVAMEAPILP